MPIDGATVFCFINAAKIVEIYKNAKIKDIYILYFLLFIFFLNNLFGSGLGNEGDNVRRDSLENVQVSYVSPLSVLVLVLIVATKSSRIKRTKGMVDFFFGFFNLDFDTRRTVLVPHGVPCW
jgi:hypothetical protein